MAQVTTKEELQKQVNLLKAQIDAMEEADKGFVPTGTYNKSGLFFPQAGQVYYNTTHDRPLCRGRDAVTDLPEFKSATDNKKYDRAFETIKLLHALSDWNKKEGEYYSYIARNTKEGTTVILSRPTLSFASLFGAFSTYERAEEVLEFVGEERFKQCYNVLTMQGAF